LKAVPKNKNGNRFTGEAVPKLRFLEQTHVFFEKENVMTNFLFLIGAGIAVATGIGAGIGIGIATSGVSQAISRQPEASGKIMTVFFLGIALAEATAIYGFVIAILIFVKAA
jgi:F-type H+-transporting ATPase subunit c